MRKYKKAPYVFWQLALWELFRISHLEYREEHKRKLVLEHQIAAIDFMDELIKEEENAVVEMLKGDEVRQALFSPSSLPLAPLAPLALSLHLRLL